MIKELFKLRHDMELLDYLKGTCHSTERGIVLRLIAGMFTTITRIQIDDILPRFIGRSIGS